MSEKKRYSIKKVLSALLWISIGTATAVLLVAAIRKDESRLCKEVVPDIEGASNNFFVDKNDIINTITVIAGRNPVGKPTGSFDLATMEKQLEKNVWVKDAELFFDNNAVLQVKVHEREPVARVFSAAGTTFYIDNDISVLPLSEKFSARLPVFTNFPSTGNKLTKADSSLLHDIRNISLAIQEDSFYMALVEQVDITPQRNFEMIPKIGNQVIVFGDGSDYTAKLEKLKLFYREVMPKAGWNMYSQVNVQYKGQVVAKRKDAADVSADSLRTLQMLQVIADRAKQLADDSASVIAPDNERNTVDSTMIQQSFQRDDESENGFIAPAEDKPTAKPATAQPVVPTPAKPTVPANNKPANSKPVNAKPANNKPVTAKPSNGKPVVAKPPNGKPVNGKPANGKPVNDKPKAAMPKRNDY